MDPRGPTVIVIDSSYALALVMPDETRSVSMTQVLSQPLLAPFIWPVELANATRNAVRRTRLRERQVTGLCADLDVLDVEIVASWQQSAQRYFEVAQAYDLTPYDALYLDLALTRRCAIATCDQRLASAAQRVGLSVHG